MLRKTQKEQIVKDLSTQLKEKNFAFFNFDAIDAETMAEFRKLTHEQNITAHVVKRKLLIRALDENKIENDLPQGFYMLITTEDEILPFKFIKTFIKDNEKGAFQGGLFEGKWIDANDADKIADLPGKEELRAKLVYLINSPLQGLHYSLSYNLAGLINILKQKAEKSA
ncbi:MAG: 50S ribosomal protein L10 [Patescibacteria group bacterium]|nr:50S ribosomal protein L10 [Patescibacteria group bacterium]